MPCHEGQASEQGTVRPRGLISSDQLLPTRVNIYIKEVCTSISSPDVCIHSPCVDAAAMSLFQNSEYQALPIEEKSEHAAETPRISTRSGRSKKLYIAVVSLISITLLAFVGFTTIWRSSSPAASPPPSLKDAVPVDEESRDFLSGLARAGDQQYLLGVGKADITG